MSVSIKYKGTEIASASTETTKTIKTAGKYCEADILVENTPDGGDAPVINPLSVTANGTYTAPSGVDGYSPVTVNVPQGITPSGNINITDTNVTDVTQYATAQVVDADLTAENIKKNVNILGVVGSFEGGGGTTITDGIVVKSRNADGSPAEIDYYGSTLYQYQFGYNGYGTRCNPFSLASSINFKTPMDVNVSFLFYNAINLQKILIPENVVLHIGSYSFAQGCTSLTDVKIMSPSTLVGYSHFQNCTSLKSFFAPKMTTIGASSSANYAMFKGCDALETVQFGSVGYGITQLSNVVFSNAQNNLVITIYTKGSYADTALANIRNGATNATIIIKASEATTYNGTAYAAGDTMITSEVA